MCQVFDAGRAEPERRTGRVVRLLPDMETRDRMARLLISVKDPLNMSGTPSRNPLLLGSYVGVDIDAGALTNVLAIQRTALREEDRVWVVDEDNRLHIRDVAIRWLEGETVYVDNALKEGETLVVSKLRVALPGMGVEPRPATTAQPANLAQKTLSD